MAACTRSFQDIEQRNTVIAVGTVAGILGGGAIGYLQNDSLGGALVGATYGVIVGLLGGIAVGGATACSPPLLSAFVVP